MNSVPTTPVELTLYSRQDCTLCDEFKFALVSWDGTRGQISLTVVDIDSDPELVTRYGLRIPVLVHDGQELCAGRFRAAALDALTAIP